MKKPKAEIVKDVRLPKSKPKGKTISGNLNETREREVTKRKSKS